MTGADLPSVLTAIPGPESRAMIDVLARHECPAITSRRARRASELGLENDDPMVWKEAVGCNVRDVDGNIFVDTTAAFGVAFIGHRHPRVVSAVAQQSQHLLHAMGDAWPDATRIALLAKLASLAPADIEVAILGLSGSDAVEAAVKTGLLATKRNGVLVFDGAYHGLSLGAVALQRYLPAFSEPFRAITHPDVHAAVYGGPLADVERLLATETIGLVLVEPIQGRGGMREPPAGWLAELTALAHRYGALVAFDEIFSGLGRTGPWFAGEAQGATSDLLCVGKALGGGFPLSACLGTRAAMDAWGSSTGQAIHTQTFLGHPVGCAAGLAVIETIEAEGLLGRAVERGERFEERFHARGLTTTGRGLMLGAVMPHAYAVTRGLLRRGYIALPAGSQGQSLGITCPVSITDDQIAAFFVALDEARAELS